MPLLGNRQVARISSLSGIYWVSFALDTSTEGELAPPLTELHLRPRAGCSCVATCICSRAVMTLARNEAPPTSLLKHMLEGRGYERTFLALLVLVAQGVYRSRLTLKLRR